MVTLPDERLRNRVNPSAAWLLHIHHPFIVDLYHSITQEHVHGSLRVSLLVAGWSTLLPSFGSKVVLEAAKQL